MLANRLHSQLEPQSQFAADLDELSLLLHDDDWISADRLTATLLRQAVESQLQNSPAQQQRANRRSLLTPETIAALPCQLLHALDDRWQQASGGHFGFSVQLQIYDEILATTEFDPSLRNWMTPHPFLSEVGWLMPLPLRPVGFLKFYNWLEFDLDAPMGHLPALWYWQVPGLYSLQMGGFLTGQGAGFGDLARLDAMLLRIARCHQPGQ
ncbi:GUN4 domain-containing protein [Nodosilinea sp. LEGE 07088]|uniref:GUN4 domain-containing protein n=1 Tax=Nodosilinea sp. LEGE 07088 TaxID=2777968 RepID=UPI00187FE9A5|nr:GUN4 domain-containing protein [Nodosilinea sp. LEGE 07088]MBE9137580.1 GUN4 domain-containing protein [Nodosilinea sp. LEGE 07088]